MKICTKVRVFNFSPLSLSYDPLKFSKGKKRCVMATPPKPFDGIP